MGINPHLSRENGDGLIYDLEVSPMKGYFYPPRYKTNILWVDHEQYLMSFAYKWVSEKRIYYFDLRDQSSYKLNPEADKELTQALHKIWDHAGYVVAYNGNRFDNKMAMTFFLRHDLPAQHKPSIDPCAIARSTFKLSSNSLANVAEELGVTAKLDVHLGDLTRSIIEDQDEKAWRMFKKYNIQDVDTLEQVWHAVRPYAKTHLNMAVHSPDMEYDACPRCGKTDTLVKNGKYSRTNTRVYQLYICQRKRGGCGHQPSLRLSAGMTPPKFK